jgi:hypothetical protein
MKMFGVGVGEDLLPKDNDDADVRERDGFGHPPSPLRRRPRNLQSGAHFRVFLSCSLHVGDNKGYKGSRWSGRSGSEHIAEDGPIGDVLHNVSGVCNACHQDRCRLRVGSHSSNGVNARVAVEEGVNETDVGRKQFNGFLRAVLSVSLHSHERIGSSRRSSVQVVSHHILRDGETVDTVDGVG